MRTEPRTLGLALLAAALLPATRPAPASAQVLVAPTIVVLKDTNRFGTFLVNNRTTEPQEVVLDFRFGYPATTQEGEMFMQYADTAAEATYSAVSWLRAFPQRFVLQPGERQTVRFMIRPPADIDAGVYWTRLVTATTPVAPPVDTVSHGVTTQIRFRLEQITTVLYETGALGTGLDAAPLEVAADTAGVTVQTRVRRTGNAPYLGTATLRLLDRRGHAVSETSQAVAIYFDGVVRFVVPRAELSAGAYTAELSFLTQRDDVPASDVVKADPILLRTTFSLD